MKTILAPVDFSDVTRRVLEAAAAQAEAFGARLLLLHVVPQMIVPNEYLADGGFIPPIADVESTHAEIESRKFRLEAEIKEWLPNTPLTLESRVLEGDPAERILEQAVQEQVDLIALGSHGHGALYHLLLGGVAEQVLHQAPCAVLVVRSNKDK